MTREAGRKNYRAIHKTYINMKETVASARASDTLRSKFSMSHSVRSVIAASLRTKNYQAKTTCKYKIDTGSDGNIMPIKMFKVLFLDTETANLNKSIDRKLILCAYNSMYITNGCIQHDNN